MSKISLMTYVKSEIPRIDAALKTNIKTMPASSRHIAEHIFAAGGKRLRPLLTILIARILGYKAEDIYPLAASVEMIHAATLLHDDVIDNAAVRRARPAAHKVFGITETILAGDALLARASCINACYGDTRLVECMAHALEKTASGQIMEIDRRRKKNLELDDYFAIIKGKTAFMISCACELGAIKSGAEDKLIKYAADFGLNLGMAFQIVDDALDFAPQGKTGKPEGGDVREGKLTPPLYLYLSALPEKERDIFFEKFSKNALSEADISKICTALRNGSYDQKARNMADSYLDRARDAFTNLSYNLPKSNEKEMLRQIIKQVRDREI